MNSPTITSPMTQMGMILGTAAYMSPEQARGRAVDRRADIWAFGCVLYEMLTGKRPFEGDTVTDIIAAVVKTEPDWDALPPSVPRAVRATMRRCLAKDPRQRLRDIGDAKFEITEPDVPVPVAIAAPSGTSSSRRTAALVLSAITVLTAGVGGGIAWRSGRDVPPVAWTGARLGGPTIAMYPRVSPDGQLLAFQAMVNGQSQVAVMKPDTGNWSVLTRDRSKGLVDSLAWSHDGARVYYDRFTDAPRGIYSVPALGGDERLLIGPADAPEIAIVAIDSWRIVKRLKAPGTVTSMAASRDGATLYVTHDGSVSAVPVDGGTARVLGVGDSVTVDPDGGDLILKLDEAERYRLVRLSPAGGSPRPIAVTGDLRLVNRPLMPGAIRNGRLLLSVASVDSWDWFTGVLDFRTGRLARVEVDSPTDFHWITWAADGSILASGVGHRSTLWKFTREAAR